MNFEFLPVSKEEMQARDWHYYDFLLISGDAYVDHPSFGPSVIGRVLEKEGYRVAILPRYGVMIAAGNIDSMVAHYTAAKKRRHNDAYSPGGRAFLRPDRTTIVYAQEIRKAYPDTPIIIGGLEASLRRFAHYDYWDDTVRPSILFDAGADLLVYGMGERATREIAARLSVKEPVSNLQDIRGTSFAAQEIADFLTYDASRLKRCQKTKKPMPKQIGFNMRSMTRSAERPSYRPMEIVSWW